MLLQPQILHKIEPKSEHEILDFPLHRQNDGHNEVGVFEHAEAALSNAVNNAV